MKRHPFVIVDVFTRSPLAGNPLAVFADAADLDEGKMQAIAREFGHSETTFVLPPRHPQADWRLRCFTPTAEVFGAGHNALGAWWVLASAGRVASDEVESVSVFHQELGDSVLPVEIAYHARSIESVSMTQSAPVFGDTVENLTELGLALGIPTDDVEVAGLRPQAVSTGAMHLLVPVTSLRALARVKVDDERLVRLVRPLGCQGAYLFTLDTLPRACASLLPRDRDRRGSGHGQRRGPLGCVPGRPRTPPPRGDCGRRAGRRDGTAEPHRSARHPGSSEGRRCVCDRSRGSDDAVTRNG